MSSIVKHSIASGLVLIMCVVFYMQSLNYPVSAARLPQILIFIIAGLSLMMLIEAFKKRNEASAKSEGEAENGKLHIKRVSIFIAMIALYILLMDIIGYFIVTPLFVFASLMYMKATNVLTAIILAVGFTAFIYGLFSLFLHVPVPKGIFF
ncbi:tripartite tricarboxylate transporter TctB family protein [Sporosarcina thermotolerans]|uniref:Tripartite tricarboxylate transporter TctB family protein n=1 Tax=Sporosarcina thermotolerans TaxID=633404 RepID=A0AAW9AAK8_9BACL|nr:tripartite tricarboxylate transporter TctB family protein [Sporosarcina thermotolerans]MDW0116163.1 tripartite tricarboxylate transporter TctB family protein [Sporosarcina thermotolerans]WHT48138.1 tripartite tricarboxylate transporter TctB family protein [Sporosarcina thermotolerans]